MFQIIFHHPGFMISVLALLSLSIICQISMGVLYHKLIRETENMSTTKNKSLQQLKLKFSSCSKLHDGIANVPIFVDKYLHRITLHKISLSTLKHLSGQLVLLAVLIAGIGACTGIIQGESFLYIVPFYIISFLGLYTYFAISSFIDISGKTNILRTNLIDYLENHLANRLEQTALDMKLIEGEDSSPDGASSLDGEPSLDSPDNGSALSYNEAKELEILLKEFLT